MPIIYQFRNEQFPEWSELKKVEKYVLKNGQRIDIDTGYAKAVVFSFDGFVKIIDSNGSAYELVSEGDVKDSSKSESVILSSGKFTAENYCRPGYWVGYCEFYVFSGDFEWCMIEHFRVGPTESPGTSGDPRNYDFNTNFFNHYHDYDEYWLIARGGGVVQSEDVLYRVEEGDLVATRRGDHHDFPVANPGYTKCIGFKSRMGGGKRTNWILLCKPRRRTGHNGLRQ